MLYPLYRLYAWFDAWRQVPKKVLHPIIEALKDYNKIVCWIASESLGQLGDHWAEAPIIEALKDEESGIYWSGVDALEKLGYDLSTEQ